jgi:hypothetical protein
MIASFIGKLSSSITQDTKCEKYWPWQLFREAESEKIYEVYLLNFK